MNEIREIKRRVNRMIEVDDAPETFVENCLKELDKISDELHWLKQMRYRPAATRESLENLKGMLE